MKKEHLKKAILCLFMIFAFSFIISCGTASDEEETGTEGGGGTGGGGGTTVGSVTVTAGNSTLPADGTSTTLITVTVLDSNGSTIANGTPVTFSITAGSLSAYSATTSGGTATTTLTSATTSGTSTVTATSGGSSGNTTVTFSSGAANTISVTASPNNLTADGTSTSTISASVTDANGNSVADGTTITFSVTAGSGTVAPLSASTSNGLATTTYTASGTAGSETISARASNGVTGTGVVTLIAETVGSITVGATPGSISADGISQSVITATLYAPGGALMVTPTTVSFSTTAGDMDNVLGGTQTTFTATSSGGYASATLTSGTTSGTATVTASAGGRSGTATVSFTTVVTSVVVTATPSSLDADGISTSQIQATVRDANGTVDGEPISFSVTSGTGTVTATATTSGGGIATATYTAGLAAGTDVVTAQAANGVSGTANITLTASVVGSIQVTAGAPTIVANGSDQCLIVARVKDLSGADYRSVVAVTFTTTAGDMDSTTAGTQTTYTTNTSGGMATALLTSSTYVGTATVRATVGGVSGSTTVQFVPGAVAGIALTATPPNLTADGISTSTVRAFVTDAQGNAMSGETISFFVTSGTGTLSAPTATTGLGVATVTYTASNSAGPETITAQSTNGTTNTVQITLIAAQVGSITVQAGQDQLIADGTSNTNITARVLDTSGQPVSDGNTVTFTNGSSFGTLSPTTATTVAGSATVVLISPTTAGTAAILQASAGGLVGTKIVTFIPGPPDSITADANPQTIPATFLYCPYDSSRIIATVTDENNNPVADGTEVVFSIDKGWIWDTYPDCGGWPDEPLPVTTSKKVTTANGTAKIAILGDGIVETGTVDICVGGLCYEDASGNRGIQVSFGGTVGAASGLPVAIELTLSATEIRIRGTGGTESATITAKVYDETGSPIQDFYTSGDGSTTAGSAAFVSSSALFQTRGFDVGDTVTINSGADNGSYSIVAVVSESQVTLNQNLTSTSTNVTFTARIKSNITFSILLGPGGGETIDGSTTSTKSTVNGQASATLNSGSVPGAVTVRVVCTQGGKTASATTPEIGIESGPPAVINLYSTDTESSVAGGRNARGFYAIVQDRFSNPVPDGTVVYFGLVDNASTGLGLGYKAAGTNGVATAGSRVFTAAGAGFQTNGVAAGDSLLVTDAGSRVRGGYVIESVDSETQLTLYKSMSYSDTNLDFVAGSAEFGLVSGVQQTGNSGIPGIVETSVIYPVIAAGTKPFYLYAQTSGFDLSGNSYNLGTTWTASAYLLSKEISSVQVSAGSSSLVADGSDSTSISATVKDASGNPVSDGTVVTFTTTAGDIDNLTAGPQTTYTSTTSSGAATATLTSPTTVGSATVRATAGGVSGEATVSFIPGPVSNLSLTATPNNLTADQTSTSTIRALVTDAYGNAVANGETISYSVTTGTGTLSAPTATTSNGAATVTYTASGTAGTETVTARATNGVSNTVDVTLIAATVASVSLQAGSTSVVADGASSTIIRATVKDTSGNNVVDGTSVTFTTTGGDIDNLTAGSQTSYTSTTANGVALATLTGPTFVGSATITATAGGVLASTSVNFIPGPPAAINVMATPNNLTADGVSTSTIQAIVTDAQGNLVANGETITYSVTSGTGTLSSITATTTSGVATVTYRAPGTGVPGVETITARALNGTTNSVNITLIAARVDSVTVRAGSSSILADGASQTTIAATVLVTGGINVPDGTTVTFASSAGTLSAANATTTNGIAEVTLTSPTNLGSATITATSGGVSAQTTVQFIAGPPASVSVAATPSNLTADGTSTSSIRVTVLDANDNPVADGETLTFSANDGVLSKLTATTTNGVATVTYTAPNYVPATNNDTITVEATNGQSGTALITLIGPQIASISLSANPASLPADGTSQGTISATLSVVGGGNPPDGTTVNFSIVGSGGGSITSTGTTSSGVAVATLTSGTTAETVTIRATAGGLIAEIQVAYTPGSVSLTIVPNSLLGTGEETATVTATLLTAAGNPAPNTMVTFTLSDTSLGSITPNQATTNAQGDPVTSTFQAGALGGTVTVTGTWTTGGVNVTGTATITILPPPAFIQVATGSPSPSAINIKGTGGQSTSQVVFDVKDTQGDLVTDGYRIDFSILSGPDGGEEISPLFATTKSGQVSTILRSGFKSGPVSIKATYFHDTNVSTTTGQISILAGPPVGEEFGIYAQYLNMAGLNVAGLEDEITVSANDIYGNPIPDETTISFMTYNTGGDFGPGSDLTDEGYASSTFISGPPQPVEGFVSLTALAVNGGRTTHVKCLAVTPAPDQHILYAGTDGGGVYKSLDNGTTWQNVSRSSSQPGQNWIDPYINDLMVDPDSPNTVYAATGYLGRGNIYRSLNGGITWDSSQVEEWNGLFSIGNAVLTLLCDDGGSDYVWAGTHGAGAFRSTDGENFEVGGIVVPTGTTAETAPGSEIFTNPANTGDGTMTEPTLSVTSLSESWSLTYVVPSSSAETPEASSSNTGTGTMSNAATSSTTLTEEWTVTYDGSAGTVTPGVGNAGDGNVTAIEVKQPNAATETWTLTCISAPTPPTTTSATFQVLSSVAGAQKLASGNPEDGIEYSINAISFTIYKTGPNDFALNDTFTFTTTAYWNAQGSVSGAQTLTATTGVPFTSDGGEVAFTITQGGTLFEAGDGFTFDTTAAETPYWTVRGTRSGLQSAVAYNEVSYSSDDAQLSFNISEGATPFAAGDSFTFDVTESGLGIGDFVRGIVKAPGTNGNTAVLYAATDVGLYTSTNGGITWQEATSFTGDNLTTLAIHPSSAGGPNDVIYVGTEDAGVWVSTTSGSSWTQYTSGMGEGLTASTPRADVNNTGTGTMSKVTVSSDVRSEYWTVTCTAEATDGGTFQVVGTVSGAQTNTVSVGALYTSDGGELSFTISDGATDFKVGDTFTFSTIRDTGRQIKDLLVDGANDLIYAVTYFWGPSQPHAVGNVYVHALNNDGTMGAGDWSEANTGLPQYDPPDDTTLFAQHALAMDDPSSPAALFAGGEGIHLYKAISGLATGSPSWNQSDSGLTNYIMARMPILMSGECTMTIEDYRSGNTVVYYVYIEDENGNPPIGGSTFQVTRGIPGVTTLTLFNLTYPDALTYAGTWRDPADPTTKNPFVIVTEVQPDDTIWFVFTPRCEASAPGCSGSVQRISYEY